MQFEKVARSFLDHLQIERALSANSIAAYKRDLAKFLAFLSEKGFTRTFTPDMSQWGWGDCIYERLP